MSGVGLAVLTVLSLLLVGLSLGYTRRRVRRSIPPQTALVLTTPKGARTAHLSSAVVVPNWHRVESVDLSPKTLSFPISRDLDGVNIRFDLEIDIGVEANATAILAAARAVGAEATFDAHRLEAQLREPLTQAAGDALEVELQAFLGSIDLGTPDRMRAVPALEALLRGAVTAILPAGYRLLALRTTSYDGV